MFQKNLFKAQLETLMNGVTALEFAEKTGFNRTYLSKYLNLRLDRPPSPDLLRAIASPLVPYETLMTTCGYLNPIEETQSYISIPIIGSIHAGSPTFAMEDVEGYEPVSHSEISHSHSYFYLRVEGDSMINARIHSGDLVFVRKQEDVESGDIAVVMIDGESATLKRVLKKPPLIILQPENPAYETLYFSPQEASRLQIIGKVLHVKFHL